MPDDGALTSPAISVSGLTKTFGERLALRGIDLEVNRGERLVIFGPNGAGKTTLVKILSTLIRPSSGIVRVGGADIASNPQQARRGLSLVSHDTFLYDDLTIYENLRFYGRMYDVPALETRIGEVIDKVQLAPRFHDKVGTLSHGMQQRASIARAILHNPSILLLDEPEGGLDRHASDLLAAIITEPGGRTVVMTTHNLERGLELADRLVILNRGRVVYEALKTAIAATDLAGIYQQYTEAGA